MPSRNNIDRRTFSSSRTLRFSPHVARARASPRARALRGGDARGDRTRGVRGHGCRARRGFRLGTRPRLSHTYLASPRKQANSTAPSTSFPRALACAVAPHAQRRSACPRASQGARSRSGTRARARARRGGHRAGLPNARSATDRNRDDDDNDDDDAVEMPRASRRSRSRPRRRAVTTGRRTGLDRADQRRLPLDGRATRDARGAGAVLYVSTRRLWRPRRPGGRAHRATHSRERCPPLPPRDSTHTIHSTTPRPFRPRHGGRRRRR